MMQVKSTIAKMLLSFMYHGGIMVLVYYGTTKNMVVFRKNTNRYHACMNIK